MASVEKIRQGLYVVTWKEMSVQYSRSTKPVKVDLPASEPINRACTLECECFRTVQPNYYPSDESLGLKVSLMNVAFIMSNPIPPAVSVFLNGDRLIMTLKDKNDEQKSKAIKQNQSQPATDCLNTIYWTNFKLSRNQYDVVFQLYIDFDPEERSSLKTGQKKILKHLESLLQDKSTADVTFRIQSQEIKAHSMILAAGSPVMAAMFHHDMKEKRSGTVEIKDVKVEVFKQMLQHMYTGVADQLDKDGLTAGLLVVADKYAVETLREDCASSLARQLRVDNASRTLILAHLHSCPELYKCTLQFMANHSKAICSRRDWMEVIQKYPELCFQAVQLMVGT